MQFIDLINSILQLQNDGLEIFNAGKSVLGKNILATHVGDYSGPQIIIQGGIHAREYITSFLLVDMARYVQTNNLIKGGGVYFIFCTNPDGVELVMNGLDAVPCEITKEYILSANGGDDNFSQYKANINLVDLNTNFDALWGGGSRNVFCPATENFVGFYPNSEREVQSLIDFTLKNRPAITISYHSKGNVIYYGFDTQTQAERERDFNIGSSISELTGYPLILTQNSTGGYKDWCIDKLKIPAYTIEVGDESIPHPVGLEYLPEIFERNKDVPVVILEQAKRLNSVDNLGSIVQNNSGSENNDGLYAQSYLARLQGLLK